MHCEPHLGKDKVDFLIFFKKAKHKFNKKILFF